MSSPKPILIDFVVCCDLKARQVSLNIRFDAKVWALQVLTGEVVVVDDGCFAKRKEGKAKTLYRVTYQA